MFEKRCIRAALRDGGPINMYSMERGSRNRKQVEHAEAGPKPTLVHKKHEHTASRKPATANIAIESLPKITKHPCIRKTP